MSTTFCEKSFYSYINSLPDIAKNSFYLMHSLLLKVTTNEINIRIENGEWQTLTPSNICFLPKGKSIEIINNDNSHPITVDILPITDEMLKYFYLQHTEFLVSEKKTKLNNRVCFTNLHENPIIENALLSIKKEISTSTDKHKIKIYLNFILSFFLLVDGFIPSLHASINVSIKDKVYDLIFHSTGKQCCTLDTVAKQLHMSASTLKRRLASEYTSFSKISLMSRMNKAMILSKVNKMPMTRIAHEVGYDDVPFFMSTFKNYYRSQPSPLL
ncbi:helix-turn-helix domain-containing protein [Providencia vermicola]|uniref:helix-turn-helix domain-containing protein n=1 Tax=Providencia vermicola TaxID=333965 RepID=UPI00352351F5